jgi:hypothetical protein|tara:strand:- start:581 stop:715 length:135 start_codon:yes stop_codon:yes gene_type:complete
MKFLTKKGAYKAKRRAVNRAARKARRDAIGGNVAKLPFSMNIGR